MGSSGIDENYHYDILTLEEVAHFLQKSPSWVYKNWKLVGGRKLGGFSSLSLGCCWRQI